MFVIAVAWDLRPGIGWRLKNSGKEGGGKPAGRGSFTIALCVYDLARVKGARMRMGEPAGVETLFARLRSACEQATRPTLGLLAAVRASLLLIAVAVSGCAPVGPNFERPAAIVSPQFKEIKGWKIRSEERRVGKECA